MVEYAIVSGRNFLNGFWGTIEPTINPLREFMAKMGLNLSVVETCFALVIIAAVCVCSFVMLTTK